MKIKNSDVVGFINNAQGILSKKIPNRIYTAISLNLDAVKPMVETYQKQYADIKAKELDAEEEEKEIMELLDIEADMVIQAVTQAQLDRMDDSEKYDALTGVEYRAIQFMILPN